MTRHLLTVCAIGVRAMLAAAEPSRVVGLEPRAPATTAAPATLCPRSGVHMMVAGGCAIPCFGDQLGLLSTLVSNITAALPGSDYYLVPYTNVTVPARSATPAMILEATAYAQACPNTPIVFLGYSVGGITVMNTLCGGLSPNLTSNVIAGILYGEETYVANMPYDKGTCTNNAPNFPRNTTALCAPYMPVMQSYCSGDDPACCAGGLAPPTHYEYPGIYDLQATAWIKSQYASYRKNHRWIHPCHCDTKIHPCTKKRPHTCPALVSTAAPVTTKRP